MPVLRSSLKEAFWPTGITPYVCEFMVVCCKCTHARICYSCFQSVYIVYVSLPLSDVSNIQYAVTVGLGYMGEIIITPSI